MELGMDPVNSLPHKTIHFKFTKLPMKLGIDPDKIPNPVDNS